MELLLLFLLALLLFGPEELPPLARLMSRTLNELKSIFQRLEKEWGLSVLGVGGRSPATSSLKDETSTSFSLEPKKEVVLKTKDKE